MKPFPHIVKSLLFLSLLPAATASEPLTLSPHYWSDQSFVKSFNGSYRINAKIEPSVTSSQRAILVRVQQLMRKGKREEALKFLDESRETSKSAALLFNKGNISFELGKLEEARNAYLAAIKIYPSFRRAHANLGMVQLREENYSQAQSSLVEAVSLGDMGGATMGMLGYCHLQAEHYASALQAYRMAQLSQPDQPDWQAGVAQCLIEIGQGKEALALIRELVKKRPLVKSYQLLLVNVLLREGHENEAVVVLEWLRRSDQLDAQYWALLAQLHARANNMKLVKPLLNQLASTLNTESLPSYLTALDVIVNMGALDYAEELLERVDKELELPQHLKHRVQRLNAAVMEKQGKPGVEAILSSVIKENPLDGEALLQLGQYYADKENYQSAVMYFDRAESQEKLRYRTFIAYSQMYVAQRRYALAIEKLEKANEIRRSDEQEKYLSALRHLVGQ